MPDFVQDNHLFRNPVEFAMSKIGGSYKIPLLWRLKDKNWRYSQLQKSLSHASDRMLSKALKELVQDGYITKEVFAEVPPRVEYSITERGMRAIPVIEALRNYGLALIDEFEVNHQK